VTLALVASLLFCTLSTLELPEFLRLADDTSNDFMLLDEQGSAPAEVKVEAGQLNSAKTAPNYRQRSRPYFHSAVQNSALSVSEFLPSLCTWRT